MPDTLAYVVNFDNSEGFAVLGAQQGLSPVYALTESGSMDVEKFQSLLESEYESPEDFPTPIKSKSA